MEISAADNLDLLRTRYLRGSSSTNVDSQAVNTLRNDNEQTKQQLEHTKQQLAQMNKACVEMQQIIVQRDAQLKEMLEIFQLKTVKLLNLLNKFLREEVVKDDKGKIALHDLHDEFENYCFLRGCTVDRDDVERLMAKLMKEFNYQYVKAGGQCLYRGIKLKNAQ